MASQPPTMRFLLAVIALLGATHPSTCEPVANALITPVAELAPRQTEEFCPPGVESHMAFNECAFSGTMEGACFPETVVSVMEECFCTSALSVYKCYTELCGAGALERTIYADMASTMCDHRSSVPNLTEDEGRPTATPTARPSNSGGEGEEATATDEEELTNTGGAAATSSTSSAASIGKVYPGELGGERAVFAALWTALWVGFGAGLLF